MNAGILFCNNSINSTIVTTYRNNNPKDMSVKKLKRKSTKAPISTYSKAEVRINPKSTDDDRMVAFIICCFSEIILTDLYTV